MHRIADGNSVVVSGQRREMFHEAEEFDEIGHADAPVHHVLCQVAAYVAGC
jgi:hypothetical protein